MASLFNYSTIKVNLEKSTRTLKVDFDRPQVNNVINNEMLFELETLLSWATNKLEICTILFSSTSETFCCGADPKDLLRMDIEKLTKYFKRIQKNNICTFSPSTNSSF